MNKLDIRVASNAIEAENISKLILKGTSAFNVLGMDCEWETHGTRRPIALLQLCTNDGFCGLFRLRFCGFTPTLKQIMKDSQILKVGVGITNSDVQYLKQDYHVEINGAMDIRYLTMQVTGSRSGSLSDLGKYFIPNYQPSPEMTRSNWEGELTQSQIRYAAEDAWLGIEIFKRAFDKLYHTYTPSKYLVMEKCQQYLDKTF